MKPTTNDSRGRVARSGIPSSGDGDSKDKPENTVAHRTSKPPSPRPDVNRTHIPRSPRASISVTPRSASSSINAVQLFSGAASSSTVSPRDLPARVSSACSSDSESLAIGRSSAPASIHDPDAVGLEASGGVSGLPLRTISSSGVSRYPPLRRRDADDGKTDASWPDGLPGMDLHTPGEGLSISSMALAPDQDSGPGGEQRTGAQGEDLFARACAYAADKRIRAVRQKRLVFDDRGKAVWQKPRLVEKANDSVDAAANGVRKAFRREKGEIMSNRPQSVLYGTYGKISLGRGATGLGGKAAPALAGDGATEGITTSAGAFSVASAAVLAKDAVKATTANEKAKRSLMENHTGAEAYMSRIARGEWPTAEEARAYLSFMGAARKVKALSKSVTNDIRRANANAVRSGPVQISNATLRMPAAFGAAGAAAGALGTAGSVLTVANGSAYVYIGVKEYEKGHAQKETAKAVLKELSGLSLPEEEGADGAKTIRRIAGNLNTHFERRHRQGVRDRRYAGMRVARGVTDILLGSGGSMFGIAALVGVGTAAAGVATAGLAVGVTAAIVAGIYLVGVSGKFHHKWKAEHTSKRRQRDAQMLIEIHDRKTLMEKFTDETRTTLNDLLAAYQSRGKWLDGEVVKNRKVDTANNEYLALHFLALGIIEELDGKPDPGGDPNAIGDGEGPCMAILRASGMRDEERRALQIAVRRTLGSQNGTQADRAAACLGFLKKTLAAALNLPFRLDADGKETSGASKVFSGPEEESSSFVDSSSLVESELAESELVASELVASESSSVVD